MPTVTSAADLVVLYTALACPRSRAGPVILRGTAPDRITRVAIRTPGHRETAISKRPDGYVTTTRGRKKRGEASYLG